jgi:hypothetical protein
MTSESRNDNNVHIDLAQMVSYKKNEDVRSAIMELR